MSEIEKMYENAGIKPKYSGWLDMGDLDTQMTYIQCDTKEEWDECVFMSRSSYSSDDEDYDKPKMEYPPFTAEKQLSLLKFCLKWGQLHILQDLDDEFRIENTCYRQGYQPTLEAAIANYINEKWEKLSEEEKQQVRGILE